MYSTLGRTEKNDSIDGCKAAMSESEPRPFVTSQCTQAAALQQNSKPSQSPRTPRRRPVAVRGPTADQNNVSTSVADDRCACRSICPCWLSTCTPCSQKGSMKKKRGRVGVRLPDMRTLRQSRTVVSFENVKKGYSFGKIHSELVISYCTTYKFTVMGVWT